MLLDFPRTQVPDSMARLCSLTLLNQRQTYSELIQIVEKDSFLSLYLHQNYKKELERNSLISMATSMGWENFRNRLAETYIHHARYNNFKLLREIDEVYDILDLEKRFDFLYPEGNSRVFLLGMYLKLSDIHVENSYDYVGGDFLSIPVEVDEILHLYKKRSTHPDWLILFTWSMLIILGKDRCMRVLDQTKGDLSAIMRYLVLESIFGPTAKCTKDNGKETKCMDRAS